ncbi:hypothetical protein HYDPIDRAFT_169377 [Hydnomerulius pinastri MD-312]|uniref:Uncharacterized protein n=1 Tax=Hydnomerulius pinastri MD-312 TaxID=994086 RepID=A0A0C9V8H3_9AGAM|nr:hypothetical protein HYDPIDRAFT_169377 [Hydnomerulius pinastri MD-312]
MCPFCAHQAGNHHNGPVDVPEGKTLKDLRMSAEAFKLYSANRDTTLSDSMPSANSPKLKVVGFSEAGRELLKESSGIPGQDWVEVQWSMMDSLLWVMQRVEKTALAGGGVIYSTGDLTMSESHFRGGGMIELLLLTAQDALVYTKNNLKTHTWRTYEPPLPESLPTDPRERARALFNLIDPPSSRHWNAYIEHRQKADAITDELMESFTGQDMDPFLDTVTASIENALDTSDLDDLEQVTDGVVILSYSAPDNGWGELNDADVLTRIHSPHLPKSVDVHFTYYHRMRMSSVDWNYTIGFRVNQTPRPCPRSYPSHQDGSIPRSHTRNGWRSFGWFYLDGRRAEHSACTVTKEDLQEVHDALFGDSDEEDSLGSKVGLVETARLLLASVGIDFRVAEDEEQKEDDGDGHRRSYREASFDFAAEKPAISAAHIRKICGIPPLEGDDTADLSQEQVTEAMDGSYDDEDEDEDDDYEHDEDDEGEYQPRHRRQERDDECVIC